MALIWRSSPLWAAILTFLAPASAMAKDWDVVFGESLDITFSAETSAHSFDFPDDQTGAVRIAAFGLDLDAFVFEWRRGGSGDVVEYLEGVMVYADTPLSLTVTAAGELGEAVDTAIAFAFLPEPYTEPNNVPAEAVELAPGEEVAFRLMPRVDRDVFAVTAPGDGAFLAHVPEIGGHPRVRVRWLDVEGGEIRPDWENTIIVAEGATYFVEVRSHDDYWREQAREEEMRLRVDFTQEPYTEPNNSPSEAVAIEVGEEVAFRLMPRVDRDVFAVTAPGDGAFLAHLPEIGEHPRVRVRWLDGEGGEIRPDWENTIIVAEGQTYFVEVRSHDDYWREQAREDEMRLRVDFTAEPYPEPNDTVAEATEIEIGEEVAFRLMPRVDRDVFAVTAPGDGAFLAHVPEIGGHPRVRVRWLDGEGGEIRPDWESTITVAEGQTYYVEVRSHNDYWREQAREEEMRLRVDFTAESYTEPNNVPAEAVGIEVGEEVAFRLMPRVDRDVFAVTAPGDGAFLAHVPEIGGHPSVRVRWLDGDGGEIRPDWESTITVAEGQTYFVEVRSHNDYWREQAREEEMRLRVDFTQEPYAEPNNSPAEAVAIEVGEEAAFRLMPRVDRDVFAVTAPGDGAFLAHVPEIGGHPSVRVRWLDGDGGEIRPDWESTITVAEGQTYYVEVRSHNDYWREQAREEEMRLRVDFTQEPYAEPNNSPAEAVAIEVGEEIAFRLMPRVDRDVFAVTAPGDGAFLAHVPEIGGHPKVRVRWLNGESGEIRPDWESTITVAEGQTYFVEVRSHNDYWREQAREEVMRLRVDFTQEPYMEPNNVPAEAVELAPGEEVAFRLMPRVDRDVFAVTAPGDGAFLAHVPEIGGHPSVRVRWLDGEGGEIRPDWESTITVAEGQTYYVEVRSHNDYWREQAREEEMRLRVDFTAESYTEPNNVPAEAVAIEVGEEVAFRLMPRVDRDVFAVTAPGDGAFLAHVPEIGGHPSVRVRWLNGESGEIRPDWESTITVAEGQTYFVEVRSHNDYWREQAREEEMRLRVDFTAEPYTEPNNTIAEALPMAPGDILEFRLMPRVDRDFFALTVPQTGDLVLELIDGGGHPRLTPYWYDATSGEEIGRNNWEQPVEGGMAIALLVTSHDDYWREQARAEPVKIWLRLRRPDGSWVDEVALPGEVALLPWQHIQVEDGASVPPLRLVAPQDGIYRLRIDGGGDDAAIIWTEQSQDAILEGVTQQLARGTNVTIEVRDLDGSDPPGRTVTLELTATNVAAEPGLYPRLPPAAARSLFTDTPQ